MRLLATVLLVLAILLPSVSNAEPICQSNPEQLAPGRWQVIEPCYSYTGYVIAYATSSNGAYWVVVTGEDGQWIWAKVLPDTGIERPEPFELLRITGPLVYEVSDGGVLEGRVPFVEIVPVERIERVGQLSPF